uniref:Uncharacterized protein n=1 Tax=Fibrocapsa japonica TaxID=94617 RepID=A0A7S2XXR8_9STRA
MSPLQIASAYGHAKVVQWLVQNGYGLGVPQDSEDIRDCECDPGYLSFGLCCNWDDQDPQKEGYDPGEPDMNGQWTPLELASLFGHAEVVAWLVTNDQDLPIWLRGGSTRVTTPLHLASARGHLEVAKWLVFVHGQDPTTVEDSEGFTPLELADAHEQQEILDMFMEYSSAHGIDAAAQIKESKDKQKLLLQSRIAAQQKEQDQQLTSMWLQRWNCHDFTAVFKDSRGEPFSPLRRAAYMATVEGAVSESGSSEVSGLSLLEAMLRVGARVNQTSGSNHETALMTAAAGGAEDACALLIKAGADIDVTNKSGSTALILSAQRGHLHIVNLLIKAGADVNMANHYGFTALMLAAEDGYEEIVRVLVEAGTNKNSVDNEGKSALMLAAHRGHQNTVKLLIDQKANVKIKSNQGETALDLAKEKGHQECIKMLGKAAPMHGWW